MDWSHPVILDVVWERLASLEGVWLFWEGRFSSPLKMFLAVRWIVKDLRDRTSPDSLWVSISRPYIYDNFEHGNRMLLCECAARRFVHTITEHFKDNKQVKVSFSGGFASWEFERTLHTVHGLSAFPACIRETTFHDGLPRNDVWIPMDIDFFFSGDPNVVLPVLQSAYYRFCKAVFNADGFVCVDECMSSYDWTLEDTVEDEILTLRDGMMAAQFPFVIIDQAVSELKRSWKYGFQKQSSFVLNTWRYQSSFEPLFPTEINVIHTTDCKETESYSSWLTSNFDLAHCSVTLTVDSSGNWLFDCDDDTLDCIKYRLLRFNNSSFTTSVRTTMQVISRIIKYYKNGFTFRGDEFYSLNESM